MLAEMKNTNEFERYLTLSDKLRVGYRDSLRQSNPTWSNKVKDVVGTIPSVFEQIYSKCDGTSPKQAYVLFDFLPGYRLMSIDEITTEVNNIKRMYEVNVGVVVPFLKDIANNYIGCYYKDGKESIVSIVPDEGVVEMHNNAKEFWNTLIDCYNEKAYFLDKDGYLDYDFDKEAVIAKKHSPRSVY